ncbi:hypothetical protein OOZ15_11980 [Galbibacter sp. EGI 63066]|uniref:hypothetical protein n=1 Tax=Galbibacter sp. EGI 63066 TaxID=2993559 RepID=UPI0022499C13|nr:hypothetical protein [Galbibacter sp. EGI 63066]MCX2680663.1 hypothetical protein [Galbibacter sp. EGI 63066]
MENNTIYKFSFTGGTVFGMLPTIRSDDVLLTIIMAAIGAVVSFLITMLLRWLVRLLKK